MVRWDRCRVHQDLEVTLLQQFIDAGVPRDQHEGAAGRKASLLTEARRPDGGGGDVYKRQLHIRAVS